ncbi:MAG: hypothetical protein AB7S77_04550 [Desulfatirhabdiaceae bacterium]
MKHRFRKQETILILAALLAAMLFSGCGRKTLPVSPVQIEPAAVTDLSGKLTGASIDLIWSIPESDPPVSRFVVYKASRAIAEGECANCPLAFVKAAEVPAVHSKGDAADRMTFSQSVKKGYVYTYKVIGIAEKGVVSGDSNLAEIRCE